MRNISAGYKRLRLLSLTMARFPIALLLLLWLITTTYSPGTLTFAIFLMLLIEASDFFDGYIARKFMLTSELGAILDPYADSIARMITYTAFAYDHLCLFAVPIVMAFRDVTVAYTRVIVSRAGGTAAARWSGKIKAGVQAAGAFVLILLPAFQRGNGASPESISISEDAFVEQLPGLLGHSLPGSTVSAEAMVVSWIVVIVTLISMIEYVAAAVHVVLHSDSR